MDTTQRTQLLNAYLEFCAIFFRNPPCGNWYKKNRIEVNKFLDPIIEELLISIPVELSEKTLTYFMGKGTKDSLHKMRSLIIQETLASFAVMHLSKFNFSAEELEKLNKAWEPFVFIDPKDKRFNLYSTEVSKKLWDELYLQFFI